MPNVLYNSDFSIPWTPDVTALDLVPYPPGAWLYGPQRFFPEHARGVTRIPSPPGGHRQCAYSIGPFTYRDAAVLELRQAVCLSSIPATVTLSFDWIPSGLAGTTFVTVRAFLLLPGGGGVLWTMNPGPWDINDYGAAWSHWSVTHTLTYVGFAAFTLMLLFEGSCYVSNVRLDADVPSCQPPPPPPQVIRVTRRVGSGQSVRFTTPAGILARVRHHA